MKKLAILMIAALSLAACDEDDNQPAALNAYSVCIQTCMQYLNDYPSCKLDCADSEVPGNPGGVTPTPGSNCTMDVCNGDYVVLCVQGTAQQNSAPCPYGCENGRCKTNSGSNVPAGCTNNEKRCNGNDLQMCSANTWTNIYNCPNGCDSAQKRCIEEVIPVCTAGDMRCNGNTLQVCSNNAWVTKENCTNGCDEEWKGCNPETPKPPAGMTPGTSCDPRTPQRKCSGDYLYYCNQNTSKIESRDCTTTNPSIDYYCKTSKYAGDACVADALDYCEYEGEILVSDSDCQQYGDEDGTVQTLICERIAGSYYVVNIFADSVCLEFNDGTKFAAYCDGTTLDDLRGRECSSCTMSADKSSETNYAVAVCDGTPLYSPGTLHYCGDEVFQYDNGTLFTGSEYCGSNTKAAICIDEIYCLDKCSSEGRTVCSTLNGNSFIFECLNVTGVLANLPIESCSNGCNSSGTACK